MRAPAVDSAIRMAPLIRIPGIAGSSWCGPQPHTLTIETVRRTDGGTQLRDLEIPYLASEERSLTRPRRRRDFAAAKEISCAFAASSNEHSDP
jgi:hypothetical protein